MPVEKCELTDLRSEYPELSDGVIILAEGFIRRLIVDGIPCSKDEYRIDDELQGLTIAAGFGFGNRQTAYRLADYVWRRLGLGSWFDVPDTQVDNPYSSKKAKPRPEREGHIYILRNASLPDMVKIGFTCKPVADRIGQLSKSTSVPTPFELVQAFSSPTPMAHEAAVHMALAGDRLPGREFFRVSETLAISTCTGIIRGTV